MKQRIVNVSGKATIRDTPVTVAEVVETYSKPGCTIYEVSRELGLLIDDVKEAWGYYQNNKQEIHEQIRE